MGAGPRCTLRIERAAALGALPHPNSKPNPHPNPNPHHNPNPNPNQALFRVCGVVAVSGALSDDAAIERLRVATA